MRRLLTIDQFAKLEEKQRDAEVGIALSSADAPEIGESGRLVRYVFSTPAVARDLHTVAARAWQLDNFVRNPVFLWAHDDTLPPIGRVTEIGDENGKLKGWVEYAERDINPFADTIYQLVRARYLNAVSTSWQPLEWSFSRDKARPGGVDFTKVDLLEISQVPLPAHPAALAEARSRGIDTGPIFSWAEKLLDGGGMILVPRNELETLRRAAKMPAAKRVAKTSASEAPEGATAGSEVRAKHTRALEKAPKIPVFQRGMYGVAQLAYLLDQLGYCQSASEYEADIEEDDSEVPAMLGEALVKVGEALIAMTQEEVAELLAPLAEPAEAEMRALSAEDREHVTAAAGPKARAWRMGLALARAGRAISSANEKRLNEAGSHHERAMKHHRSMAEHHGAVAEHIDSLRASHEKATKSHEELGQALRAVKDEPDNAGEHVTRALKSHRAVAAQHEAIGDACADMSDRHQDTADSHAAMGRSMKAVHRCMRSVLAEGEEAEPAAEPAAEPDDAKDDEAAKSEQERRARRARALQLAQEPLTKN